MIVRFSTGKLFAAVMLLVALSLGGCGSGDTYAARDFNELIPRMMKAVNQGSPQEAAANLFNVTSADERRDAVAYLETRPYGHAEAYMKAYKLLATDPHPMVRAQAMRALGSSHDPSIVNVLVKGLNDSDVTVRRDASMALQSTYSEVALESMILHLKGDEDEQVRTNLALAMVQARNQKSIRALIDALDDSNAAVNYWAHQSLMGLTQQDIEPNGKLWLEWYRKTYPEPGTTPSATTRSK